MMREFTRGMSLLGGGFLYWRRRPRLMAFGVIPAVIVAAVLLGGLIALATSVPGITVALTPFAEGWPGLWASVIRIAVGTALIGAALVIVAISFTALTLLVGEPFYERIWRAVENDLGDAPAASDGGFWRSVADSVGLVFRGIGVALFAALLGLIPGVGGVISAVVGVSLTGLLLADELSSRALTARGVEASHRRALMRQRRALTLGFGVATQLCFLVPGGAVATMPAAVAGSTLLARELLTPNAQRAEAPDRNASA